MSSPGYMSKVGMASGPGGWLARATGRLARLIRTIGDQLFQAEDARARQRGWQILARRGGLARTCRDPRFDSLRRCPVCRATGTGLDHQACGYCEGAGRITVPPAPLSERGWGR
jgi:hypothetical protein